MLCSGAVTAVGETKAAPGAPLKVRFFTGPLHRGGKREDSRKGEFLEKSL